MKSIAADECEGLCDTQAKTISLAPDFAGDAEEEVFMYELLHACGTFAGFQDGKKYAEEEIVTRLAPILQTVFRENGCYSWTER